MTGEPKTYWGSLEELHAAPEWKETLGKEFPAPPLEQKISGLERREFLKIMGAGFLMGTFACTRRPVEKIIPYVNKPEEVTPGVANWYASTCGECPSACGLLVKTREGRPVKLEGNPEHPLSRGGLCARGQASLLNLYDPDRLKGPLRRIGADFREVSGSEIDLAIDAILDKARMEGKAVCFLSGVLNSPSSQSLVHDFLGRFPISLHAAYETAVPEEVGLGQELSYGTKVTPRYRLEEAKIILSFGADFLGTWLSPVEFAKQFSQSRALDSGRMSRLVCVESALSLTGTNADIHWPVQPGEEVLVALALTHEIVVAGKHSLYAGDATIVKALSPYSIETVSAKTGLETGLLKKIADDLWSHRGEGLVLGGSPKIRNAVALQVVVNLLNSILENDGVAVDAVAAPSLQAESSFADLKKLIAWMQEGKVGVLFIHRTNPIFSLPPSLGFQEALKKIKGVVSLSDRMDETSALAHFIYPDSHYLESWGDANSQRGLYTLFQPVVAPLYQTRSFQESFLQWGHFGTSWYHYIRAYWQTHLYPSAGNLTAGGLSFDAFWNKVLKEGVWDALGPARHSKGRVAAGRLFRSTALSDLSFSSEEKGDLKLVLYPSVTQWDGRSINNGWLQELADPVSKIAWGNYLSVAPKTARSLSLSEGDVVRVKAGEISLELPVHWQPKLHEKTVMAAFGYGRTAVGRVGNQVGANVSSLQEVTSHGLVWGGRAVHLVKTGQREKLASTQGHHTLEGRPIVQEMAFAEYQKNPSSVQEAPASLPSLWPVHEYTGHRWGMAIDMNACTGCNACVIGCQAENNIPIVGKEQVTKGREMHWIRIDRYYSGKEDRPDVSYQPMLCQHCENAPCETVCPTLATIHNDEGLNMQTYNRCVGTRYCSNNCPYKVRRFNYFDYSKQYDESPLHLVLNPDITVRTKGIMEKCTFCIQRIQEAKDRAKDDPKEGSAHDQVRKLRDGEIRTACQQSCPADAIVFGDTNDPESRISKLKNSPRGFRVLEDLNVKPQITYLAKVRNG